MALGKNVKCHMRYERRVANHWDTLNIWQRQLQELLIPFGTRVLMLVDLRMKMLSTFSSSCAMVAQTECPDASNE